MTKDRQAPEAHAAIVTHLVPVSYRTDYAVWLTGITQVARSFPGHLRADVFRSDAEHEGFDTHQIVVTFASPGELKAWLTSDERRHWLEWAEPLIGADPGFREIGLLEQLVSPEKPAAPAQYKIVLLTWLGVTFCVMVLAATVGSIFAQWPFPVRHTVNSGFVVFALAYAVMPVLRRVFRVWLEG